MIPARPCTSRSDAVEARLDGVAPSVDEQTRLASPKDGAR